MEITGANREDLRAKGSVRRELMDGGTTGGSATRILTRWQGAGGRAMAHANNIQSGLGLY